jgi:hypothetical protein
VVSEGFASEVTIRPTSALARIFRGLHLQAGLLDWDSAVRDRLDRLARLESYPLKFGPASVQTRIRHFRATSLQSDEIVPSQDFLAVGQPKKSVCKGVVMFNLPFDLWNDESGQDIAEYAVVLAVMLVIVVGTIRLWHQGQ